MKLRILSTIPKLAVILFVASVTSLGQQERNPDRGYRAGNSYSLSELENVNLTNGNLMLTIPLASLPAGRGTSPGYTVALHYNSKLWNVKREFRTDGIGENFEDHRYTRELLEQSPQGGWHLDSGFHQLRLVHRFEVEPEAPCYVGEEGYRRNGYSFKLELQLPNGSVTEFQPRSIHASQIADDGFFSLDPWGVKHSYAYLPPNEIAGHPTCSSEQVLVENSGLHYYSEDGSRLRLFVPYQPGVPVSLMRWSLYFPNGQVIENKPQDDTTIHQRLTERNGNRIVWKTATLNGVTGTKIENDVGQFIFLGDKILQPGVNGALLETEVSSKSVWVYHKYRATTDINAPSTTQHAELFESLVVVDKITLPQQLGGLTYDFTYHAANIQPTTGNYTAGWGELASIKLPSGAKADYSYSLSGNDESMEAFTASEDAVRERVLTYDEEYDGLTQQRSEPTSYSVLPGSCCSSVATPDGQNRQLVSLWTGPLKGYVYRTNHASGAVEEKLWVNRRPMGGGSLKIDPFVKTEYTSVADANGNPVLTAIKDYDYDQNGNLLELREYDWVPFNSIPRTTLGPFSETLPYPMPTGLPASGLVLKRRTSNSYYNPTPNTLSPEQNHANHHSNPAAPKLLNLIKSTEVRDGSNSPVSRTEFFYDGGLLSPNKGNLTETRVWDSTKGAYSNPLLTGSWLATATQYNSFGAPELVVDARGIETKLIYGPIATPSGVVSDLYPTQTITAWGTPVARTSTAVYDFYTGLVTTATDSDNNVSTITSYDALGRPVLVRVAAGLAVETQTSTQYFDAARRVVVRSDMESTGDLKLVSIQHFDQLGRLRLTRQLESFSAAGLMDETMGIKVQTRYLNDPCQPPNNPQCVPASYVLTSNPYRAATSGAAASESTMGWTRSRAYHDGRTVEAQTFAGSVLPAPWGGNATSTGTVTTAYDGMFTTVTDQAWKVRRSRVDGLGRLIRVDEPSDAANTLGTQDSPTQATNYQYDALSNLIQVTQGNQTPRSFSYSSLSRLTSASNPESGVISYEYDENGNLKKKIDPRFVPNTSTKRTTTYEYDALGRVTSRVYNDGTPNVSYSYDAAQVAFAKGRLTTVSSSVSSYSYKEYDPLGRVKTATQTTDGQAYTMSYAYNRAGAITSQTYPSGRVVSTNYDGAGRIAGVKNNATGSYYAGAASTDATNRFQYSVHGAIQAMKLGNNLWEHANFNSRFQVTQIGLGTSSTDSSKFKLAYAYGILVNGVLDPTRNNGNVQSQTITSPGLVLTQSYTYDELNRLKSAQEMNGSAPVWKQTFSYDRFGNRRFDATNTTLPQITPQNEASTNPAISTANNRLSTAGYRYDLAGNLECDPAHPCGSTVPFKAYYEYDGDNRIKNANSSASSGGATYFYDGEGRRVKKIVAGPATATTVFVYDIAGQLIAEYSNNQQSTGGTSYLTADHLGTPRVITKADGSVSGRHDYQPFGEEISAGYGGRANVAGYPPNDSLRHQFTRQERDIETGLDYFLARYYSSVQGRFTSTDPLMASGRAASPQSWNRYSYVLNNPLKFVDPTGLEADDSQEFTINPCEYGTAGCSPVKLATVTVTVGQGQPVSLETTDVSIIESVTLFTTQVASDTVIGAGKSVYNTVAGAASLVNAPIDYGLSFFTDFQFGQVESYQASTPGEQSAMYGMMVGSLMVGGYNLFGGTALTTAVASAGAASNEISSGLQVYRVFGDKAAPFGRSFTTVNPATVSNYRSTAGLPVENTGRFVLEGILNDTRGITFRQALPGAGGPGGLPELVIPNAARQVTVTRVSGVNPPF